MMLLDPQDEDLRCKTYESFRYAGGSTSYVHRLVAERVLGRALPPGADVHHINENKLDNRRCNLLICPSRKYHMELHQRMKVRDAGGDPWNDKWCAGQCQRPISKLLFTTKPSTGDGLASECRACANARRRGKGYSKRAHDKQRAKEKR